MKKALVTGGSGNLGRLLSIELRSRGVEVLQFDIPAAEPESKYENEVIVSGDVRDKALLEKLLKEHKPDAIFHLASLLSGTSEADLEMAWEVNATASFDLMRLAMANNVGQFFFASTLATYGAGVTDPLPEDEPQWPDLFYGATKVAVERLGVYFKLKHGLDFRCLRFPLVLSPYAPPGALTAYPSHAFKAACNGESSYTFPVSGHIGTSTLFIDDVIASIANYNWADKAALNRHAYSLHSYILSGEMVEKAIKSKYPDFSADYAPIEAAEHMLSGLPDIVDDAHARADWKWMPEYDFDKTAAKMFELFQK